MSKSNPLRFSTKFMDDETELVYYGRRYYNPSTGRWLSRDSAGEKGGLNLYAFTRNSPVNAIDPWGLADLWTFSGINAWNSGAGKYEDYVFNQLALAWTGHPADANSFISTAGIKPHYWPPSDGKCVLAPWSRSTLDAEAASFAGTISPGAFCSKKIGVLMIAPKTHTLPPKGGCCSTDIKVYWNPYDPVPNQGISSPESPEFWSQWGTTYTVNTGGLSFGNHASGPFIDSTPDPLLVRNPTPPPMNPGGTQQPPYQPYVPSGQNTPSPIDFLNQWQNDKSLDYIFVCHSQGCNIAMQVLQQGCQKH
jgi:RHS repeat-associated protein